MDLGSAYRGGLSWLSAVQVAKSAIPSGTLAGTTVPLTVLRPRLAETHRFWMVQVDGRSPQTAVLYGLYFRQAWTWHTPNIWLQLYVPSRVPWGTGDFQYHPHSGPPWYTRRVG
jgi:hypothetical protein